MASYKIRGGNALSGRIQASGSINGTLPVLCATLLSDKKFVIKNVPDTTDIRNFIEILAGLGSKVHFENNAIEIVNSEVNSWEPNKELIKKLRGSILLIGPLLSRFQKVALPYPGGDMIGKRPIDAHLAAMQALGGVTETQHNNDTNNPDYIKLQTSGLKGGEVILNEMSVTATENAVMAAVKASGTTLIHLAATEPHVQDLCRFLNKMGARISGIGTHDLRIEGVQQLQGAEHAIIFDNEVAVSYMNLAAATKSEILIENIDPKYLYSVIAQFRMMGVNFDVYQNSVKILKPENPYRAAKISSNVYPGLLTDYVPPFSVLATQAHGTSIIHEWMYEGRLGYVHELSKMGARTRILDQHRAEIDGPTKLHGTNVSSLDVRAGMVMVIAALVAEGQSVLHEVEHIERKYESIVDNLKALGADLQRIE